jgi:hypothetical protein
MKIENGLNKYFYLNMLEEVESNQLNIGQAYFINRNEWDLGDVLFNGYNFPNLLWVTFIDKNLRCQLNIHENKFYRYVSKYEYYMALKEKYDQTCLNIVLKRLVNETFEW